MNKFKTLLKIIFKDALSLIVTIFILLIWLSCLVLSICYTTSHEETFLVIYISVVSMMPVGFALFIYSIFKAGKMIIFRQKYEESFKRLIFALTLFINLGIVITNLPFVYYSLNNKVIFALFPIYIVVFNLSLNIFSAYFILFLKKKTIAILLIVIIIQVLLNANSLYGIDSHVAKLIFKHFSIIGILESGNIEWGVWILIMALPTLTACSIILFKNKIDWSMSGI